MTLTNHNHTYLHNDALLTVLLANTFREIVDKDLPEDKRTK